MDISSAAQLKNVMYVYNTKTSWTKNDYEILEEHFEVSNCFVGRWFDFVKYINPFFIQKHDIIILWFASLSFFPITVFAWLFRKKIVIIAGGFDVVKLPVICYGAYIDPWYRSIFRRFIFWSADQVISVSNSNQKEVFNNVKVPAAKSTMIYHGFKDKKNNLISFNQRKNQLVTIGAINNETYLRKGLKYFLELAKKMPEWDFILIGKVDKNFEFLKDFEDCSNLLMTGYITDEELDTHLNESKFYIQLSQHEGFGCSIVDAALMGCYPIVYDRFAMPEVVEGCGEIVALYELDDVSSRIEKLSTQNLQVEEIRSHYQKKFSFNKRKKRLINSLTFLMSQGL